jgi:hypothetical protein
MLWCWAKKESSFEGYEEIGEKISKKAYFLSTDMSLPTISRYFWTIQ